jgi:hypothetical protein
MIFVVIYIEPLLRRIAEEARSVAVSEDNITSLAYADDINYILQDDEECDRVSQAIRCFCIESNAKVNYQKSSFLRINKYKLGSHKLERRQQIEGVGFHIWNYERIINTINFMIKPKLSKKFKPGPESVGFEHVYLSKTVVHQPNYASRKSPLGQDKKGY